jgi:threonylcarbamoyladenosine tRNA methylthiotransferase MtaB
VGKKELLELPEFDFVLGTSQKQKIFDYFSESLAGKPVAKDQTEKTLGYLPEVFPGSRNARASIKIQDGCNFSCSFCIIPQARGRSRSLPLENVLKQIQEAYEQGFNEVVLTGIHLAHYGWDKKTHLEELLKAILAIPQGPRIRLTTLDPFEISDSLIEMVADNPRICPHFHIAIQSGSDDILKSMRRIYKSREFIDVTQKIQKAIPDCFVGVDVIVGFPGETEKEFQETVECLDNSYWTKLHVFSFSARNETVAATMQNKVPSSDISRRSEILRNKSSLVYESFLNSQIGKQKQVILEKPSIKFPHLWQGHTENYLPTLSIAEESAFSKQVISCYVESVRGERLVTNQKGIARFASLRGEAEAIP